MLEGICLLGYHTVCSLDHFVNVSFSYFTSQSRAVELMLIFGVGAEDIG